MPNPKNFWNERHSDLSGWPCPDCEIGHLGLVESTLSIIETGSSIEAHSHDAWEPEWIDERFSCLLKCRNDQCGEIVAVSGFTAHYENHDYDRQIQNWDREYQPKSFVPPVPIFRIPDECPPEVAKELDASFALFWSDVGSSANRLRAATEALLTDKKVAKIKTRKRKRVRLNLHERIEILRQKNEAVADYLLAIKWLGNEGSHHTLHELAREDLLAGFEIFDHLVGRIYVRREEILRKKAKAIKARKGRAKRRKRKSFG